MKKHAFYKTVSGIMGLFLCLSFFTLKYSAFSDVNAKEDDEHEYEEEDSNGYQNENSVEDEVVATEKVTVSDTVSKEVTTTTYADTDGDGILNRDDRYPTINDHFIATDDNRNGIVDRYEQ